MTIFGIIVIVSWVVFLMWRVNKVMTKHNAEIVEIEREDNL